MLASAAGVSRVGWRFETTVRVEAGTKKNTAFPKTCPLTVSLFLASFANSRFQVTYYFSFFFSPFPLPPPFFSRPYNICTRCRLHRLDFFHLHLLLLLLLLLILLLLLPLLSLLINRFPSKIIARKLTHARDVLLRIYFAFYRRATTSRRRRDRSTIDTFRASTLLVVKRYRLYFCYWILDSERSSMNHHKDLVVLPWCLYLFSVNTFSGS